MADPAKVFDGVPCKKCGGTLRWKSSPGSCVACGRQRQRAKYANDPEWAERQRERQRNRQRDKRTNDPEWAERERQRKNDWYSNVDHLTYYGRQLKNRRRMALKRMEARHGSL